MFSSADEVLDFIKAEDVKFVDVRFCDLPGVMQHFNVPAKSVEKDFFTNGQDLTRITNTGRLSNDRTHQIKVYGTYVTPFNLNIGLSSYFRTGTPLTRLWGYGTATQAPTFPGRTFEAQRNRPITVSFVNRLVDANGNKYEYNDRRTVFRGNGLIETWVQVVRSALPGTDTEAQRWAGVKTVSPHVIECSHRKIASGLV